jgi:catechol 1,2-dioxygenase
MPCQSLPKPTTAKMKRRIFLKNATVFAASVTVSGFIRFDGDHYVGDCETTSDILGPYYRPDSPVRNNLRIKGGKGALIELSGTIKHKDCVTVCKKAKIELWHCDGSGVYDNSSNEYRYRGTTFSDDNGHYSFNTILPVPYDTGVGMRPAHFHLMFTADGYMPLVTQLYFTGDENIKTDRFASSPFAKNRILQISNMTDGTKKVLFDVTMSTSLKADPEAIERLTGIYTDLGNKENKTELFKKGNDLWMKNEAFGEKFEFAGNNTFEYAGMPPGMQRTLHFDLAPSGNVQLTYTLIDGNEVKQRTVSLKAMN